MTYLFDGPTALAPFRALGRALSAGDRMPVWLPRVETDAYTVAGKVAARRVVAGADVMPWRPAVGVYMLLEEGTAAVDDVCDVEGVAGVWWAVSDRDDPVFSWGTPAADDVVVKQVTYCFLDDDPVAVAERLRPILDRRWGRGGVRPLLAAPFFVVRPHEWDRYLP
jgi:hypothetical protein